jgi:hypothetical protein
MVSVALAAGVGAMEREVDGGGKGVYIVVAS